MLDNTLTNPGPEARHPATSLRLLSGDVAVPAFHAPGLEPQPVLPGSTAAMTLHYSVQAGQLAEALYLTTQERRIMVRDASPFRIDSLEENRIHTMKVPVWK